MLRTHVRRRLTNAHTIGNREAFTNREFAIKPIVTGVAGIGGVGGTSTGFAGADGIASQIYETFDPEI